MRRIKSFSEHVNESFLNEGIISWVRSKIKSLTGWAKDFYTKVADGKFKRIPEGPNKGKPVVMLFAWENGSIEKQLENYFDGRGEGIEEAIVPLEYPEEDQSVRNVSAEELIDEIKFLWSSNSSGGRGKPIFIYGAPGIGKTQIVSQVADEIGKLDVIFMDLQFMSPEDFKGVPSLVTLREPGGWIKNKFDVGDRITVSNPPFELPRKNDGRKGIIFLDEMNRANEIVQNSLMNFVQSGRIGTYQMEKRDWILVAAGNRPSEAPSVRDFDFALADRFTIVNYVPTLGIDKDTYEIKGGWAKWASQKNTIIPEVIYFLAERPDLFHKLDTDKKVLNFPTPRSWTDGALILHDRMKHLGVNSWRDLNLKTIENIFFDQVGPEAAGQFAEYLRLVKIMSKEDMKEVIESPENAKIPEQFKKDKRLIYGLCQNLLNMISDGDPEKLYNLCLYASRYNQNEILTWVLKRVYDRYPEFKRFDRNFSSEPGWEWKNKAAKLAAEVKKRL